MLRILIFLGVVFALGIGFAWIADNPGLVTITLPAQAGAANGQTIEVSLMLAVVAIVSIVAIIMIVWSIIMTIWRSPEIFSRWRKGRRKDRGYAALSRGMIAAAAGDAANARKLTKESSKLLANEPLVELLDAQTALLEDKRDVAQAKFETMLESTDTRLLGLRGLHVEAEKQGEVEAAAHYAERAMEIAPDAPWAGAALLRHRSQGGDWEGALKALESSRWSNKLSKKENNRLKAVLQTAQAMSLEDSSPDQARTLALSAHKLAPSLVPAAVIAARISSRLGDIRKATKVLEATWKLEPHPEIAEAYVHVRSGDSAVDRLKRARILASKRENHVEGRFAVAGAAIDATDWQTAREALASILRSSPTERACLLMADIEEAEHGDRGRMRDWLSRAVRAPRDPAWTADGYIAENWAPVSPISGRLDAFEWKVPVEMLEGPAENADYSEFATEPLEDAPVATDALAIAAAISTTATATEIDGNIIDAESADADGPPASSEPDKESGLHEDNARQQDSDQNIDEPVEPASEKDVTVDDLVVAPFSTENKPVAAKETAPKDIHQAVAADTASDEANTAVPEKRPSNGSVTAGENKPKDIEPSPMPDDPGVRDEDQQVEPRRFKLF